MKRREFITLLGGAAATSARAQQAKRPSVFWAGTDGSKRGMSEQEAWQLTFEAAKLYERYPGRYILGPWAPLLVDAARIAAGQHVLDVACGTGVVARIAAQRVGHVVDVDLNPGMIAVARSLPRHRLAHGSTGLSAAHLIFHCRTPATA
jgi:SAM-dependent methyltransferase